MVDYESALAIANLTQEEVDAIAHHEDMTAFAAMEMGNYLCETPWGERRLKRIILDEIDAARERGDHAAAAKLRLVVKHFVETHPKAA
jgi:hypothetical protein